MNSLPKLPARAAYLYIDNASKRNALSLSVIRDLTAQLRQHLTSPLTNKPLLLPGFKPSLISDINSSSSHRWLTSPTVYNTHRSTLPKVLVLRSSGPVFSSGHDLSELLASFASSSPPSSALSEHQIFKECATLMALFRQSPVPIVCAVQGLATAAGCQLALSADITLAKSTARFQLPGMSIGLPCTSPVTAVSRRVGNAMAYRMFALGEPVEAKNMGGAVEVVEGKEGEEEDEALDRRVTEVVEKLVELPGQMQAFGKWAFWTQAGLGSLAGGDALWAGSAMAAHLQSSEAREGMRAFMDKKKASWLS